jgi:hypothetical protein
MRPEAWRHVHELYRIAEQHGLTEWRVTRPGVSHTTVYAEYASLLMWMLLSEPVPASDMTAAENLLLATGRELEIDPAPIVGWHSHGLDLAASAGPVAWLDTHLKANLRYLGLRAVTGALRGSGTLGESLAESLDWAWRVAMQCREERQEGPPAKPVECVAGAERLTLDAAREAQSGWSLRRMDTRRAVLIGAASLNRAMLPGQWLGYRVTKPGASCCLARVVRVESLPGRPGERDEVAIGVETLGQVMGVLRLEGASARGERVLLTRDGGGALSLLMPDTLSRLSEVQRLVGRDYVYRARIGAGHAGHGGWSLMRVDVLGREALAPADMPSGSPEPPGTAAGGSRPLGSTGHGDVSGGRFRV